jgi:hypothetical protein
LRTSTAGGRAYHPAMPLRARQDRAAILPLTVLAGVAAAGLSCRAPRPCSAVPSTTAAAAPRRDHCLAPPWVLDPARPESGAAGWSAAVCADGPGSFHDAADRARRSAYFIHDGTRAISESELRAVQEAVRGLGIGNGLGGCCSPNVAGQTHVSCLKFWVEEVCRLPLSRIVQTVDEALRHLEIDDVRVGLDVTVGGMVGPRCEAIDPGCGPLSSREWEWGPDVHRSSRGGCVAGRVRVAEPNALTPGAACAHDGECLVAGCGETCLRWDQPLGPSSCEDRGRLEEPPVTYCGCVSGRCDWFRPVAP